MFHKLYLWKKEKWMENTKNHRFITYKKPLFRKGFFCIVFFLVSFAGKGQFFDSIATSIQHRPKLDVKFDTRHGFISANVAKILGFKFGLDFNKTFKVGMGYNLLFSNINNSLVVLDQNGQFERVNGTFDFQYFALYAEYVFYKNDPWEISILAHAGGGFSRYKYTTSNGYEGTTSSKLVVLYEPYMTAQYKFLKYFGVGAGVGYRLAYSPDKFSRIQLTSPIYVFKGKIFLYDLYVDFIKKK